MNLNFKTQEQKLVRIDSKTVAENSVNYLFAVFDLDESWKGFAKKAVFEYRGKAYSQLLEEDGCPVPCEVIRADGFYLSLLGMDAEENIRITSTRIKVGVEKGPVLEAENSSEPTLTELEQLTAAVGELKEETGNIRSRLEEYTPSEPSLTQECDPTVSDWAKQPVKPVYTAEEVGADPAGTAASRVDAHNKATASHGDIRKQLKYTLIRSVSISDTDAGNGCNAVDVEIDGEGKGFRLKSVTCFCILPAASSRSAVDMLLKTDDTNTYTSVHRRTDILNTAARYYRVSADNEGYWTARSILATDSGASNDMYASFARNSVVGNAVGVRVATGGAVFPAGTSIEIWGVKV